MRNVLKDFGIEFKYSAEYERRILNIIQVYVGERELYDAADWMFSQMKDRLVVGQCRYGRAPMINTAQEAAIGKDWARGFDVCATNVDDWRSGLRNKTLAFEKYGNGDLLPDIANYAMFRFMFDDNVNDQDMVLTGLMAIFSKRFQDHPTYHEEALDQGIHGKDRSGSARITTTFRV